MITRRTPMNDKEWHETPDGAHETARTGLDRAILGR